MQTQCDESRIEFHGFGERILTADIEGGNTVSDGGVPLISDIDRMFRVLERYADCFADHRDPKPIEHSVLDLVRQRSYGLCLGYEDLNDHDRLRADALISVDQRFPFLKGVGPRNGTRDRRRTEYGKAD